MRPRSAHPSTPMHRAVRPGHIKGRPHAARAPRARSHETARRHACPGEMDPTHRSCATDINLFSEKFRRFFGSASGLAATQGTNCRPSWAVSDARAKWCPGRFRHNEKLSQGDAKRVLFHSVCADDVMREFGTASKLNADLGFLNQLRALGRERAQAWIDHHLDDLGSR